MALPSELFPLLERLKAALPRSKISADTISIYCETLAKYDLGRLTAAVAVCTEHCKFFPSIAEIVASMPVLPAYEPPPKDLPPWDDVESAALVLGRQVCTLTLADGTRLDVRDEDLRGPKGERGMPNAVLYEARAAMQRKIGRGVAGGRW